MKNLKIKKTTKKSFLKPYKDTVLSNDAMSKDMKKKGMTEEEINDYLQAINE